MEPSLSSFLKLEVLHCVGHIRRGAVNPYFLQGPIQQPSRRTDERLAAPVFFVTRLLSDEYNRRRTRTLSEYGL